MSSNMCQHFARFRENVLAFMQPLNSPVFSFFLTKTCSMNAFRVGLYTCLHTQQKQKKEEKKRLKLKCI